MMIYVQILVIVRQIRIKSQSDCWTHLDNQSGEQSAIVCHPQPATNGSDIGLVICKMDAVIIVFTLLQMSFIPCTVPTASTI